MNNLKSRLDLEIKQAAHGPRCSAGLDANWGWGNIWGKKQEFSERVSGVSEWFLNNTSAHTKPLDALRTSRKCPDPHVRLQVSICSDLSAVAPSRSLPRKSGTLYPTTLSPLSRCQPSRES